MLLQECGGHHGLEHLILEAGLHLRRQLTTEALLPRHLFALPLLAGGFDRDLFAVGLGGVVAGADAQIDDAVGPPDSEHEYEGADHRVCKPALRLEAVSDPLEHD
jgi:hypothetical protein